MLELLLVTHGHDIGYRELAGRGEGFWNRDIGN